MTEARFHVETRSPEETEQLGERWGAVVEIGDVLLLSGDLGAGKTTLVRGLARGLGVTSPVKSPTFALHLTYPGRVPLHHLDLYRVEDRADLGELGLDDVLGCEGVCVVEWGERLAGEVPPGTLRLALEDRGPTERRVAVAGPREGVERLRDVLGGALRPEGEEGLP